MKNHLLFSIHLVILTIFFTACLFAEKTEWSESTTLKTKRIFDDKGDLVYEVNYDKDSGIIVGTVFDTRPKATVDKKEALITVRRDGGKYVLAHDSLIKVKLRETLDSRSTKVGEKFTFVVVEDVEYEGKKIISTGATGTGIVKNVRRHGRWGRSGRINCQFNHVTTPTGKNVTLAMSKRARECNESVGYAAGASMVGLIALGPIGIVGGMFVYGKDVTIPKGSVFYLGVDGDVNVFDR